MKTKILKPFEQNGSRYCTGSNGQRVCTGAMMGRADSIPEDFLTVTKLRLERVRPVGYDYDKGGAYWGGLWDKPLYCAWGDSETEQAYAFFRAKDRADAKRQAVAAFPNARFYR